MAERSENIVKPSALAKELDVHLGTIYGLIKRGRVKSYREADDDSEMVDRNEVKLALSEGRRRGGSTRNTAGKSGRSPSAKAAPRLPARKGDIISYEKQPAGRKGHGEREIAQVGEVRPVGEGMVRIYDGREQWSYADWRVSSLSERMAQGVARIERPAVLLSMILYQWVRDEKDDLALALERFMDDNDIEVVIPELESDEPVEDYSTPDLEETEDE